MDAQPIIDHCTAPHFDWARRNNLKVQPRRCEDLQVFGISEKQEDVVQRYWEPLF